jgi:hypothetical protein
VYNHSGGSHVAAATSAPSWLAGGFCGSDFTTLWDRDIICFLLLYLYSLKSRTIALAPRGEKIFGVCHDY